MKLPKHVIKIIFPSRNLDIWENAVFITKAKRKSLVNVKSFQKKINPETHDPNGYWFAEYPTEDQLFMAGKLK